MLNDSALSRSLSLSLSLSLALSYFFPTHLGNQTRIGVVFAYLAPMNIEEEKQETSESLSKWTENRIRNWNWIFGIDIGIGNGNSDTNWSRFMSLTLEIY